MQPTQGTAHAAIDIMFVYLTGLRIEEAKRFSLDDFPQTNVITNVRQSKSKRLRPWIGITQQFREVAELHNWSRLTLSRSSLFKILQQQGVNVHSLRHSHLTTKSFDQTLEAISKGVGHGEPRPIRRSTWDIDAVLNAGDLFGSLGD